MKAELARSYPDAKPGTVAAWTGVLLRFAFDPDVGDLLAHPERASRTVSLGRITSDYHWEAPDRHCRQVSWLAPAHSSAALLRRGVAGALGPS